MRALSFLIVLAVPFVAFAEIERVESQNADQPLRYRLTVDPAAEPDPPLKYELLPNYWERKPGNAAQFYLRAQLLAAALPKEIAEQYQKNEKTWTVGVLDEAGKAAVTKWLAAHESIWGELRTAAYRETCEFDYRLRDLTGPQAIAFLLPELQGLRQMARALRVKAHAEILEGRLAEALETLRWGYQLGHDVGTPPILVAGLVGVACAEITSESLRDWIAAPGSPNLYWAVASLPRPLVDLNRGLQYERGLAEQMFPALKDAETAQRSPDEWRRVVQQAIRAGALLGNEDVLSPSATTDAQANVISTLLLVKIYPEAKRRLLAAGFDPQQVEAMPVAQVVTIQTARVTKYAYQELLKWTALPYDQASARMQASEARLKEERILVSDASFSQGALPIAPLLMPALAAVRHAQARLDRNLAALQLVEALRWHAAVHQGQLPATLDAITVVPLPRNPVTGQPFTYRLENHVGILDLPPLPGQKAQQSGVRYEIVIRQGGPKNQGQEDEE